MVVLQCICAPYPLGQLRFGGLFAGQIPVAYFRTPLNIKSPFWFTCVPKRPHPLGLLRFGGLFAGQTPVADFSQKKHAIPLACCDSAAYLRAKRRWLIESQSPKRKQNPLACCDSAAYLRAKKNGGLFAPPKRWLISAPPCIYIYSVFRMKGFGDEIFTGGPNERVRSIFTMEFCAISEFPTPKIRLTGQHDRFYKR